MSDALNRIKTDTIAAMKAGDRSRLDVLRQFSNRVQMIAKNDQKSPNRAVADEDVITAGLKIVKEANETRAIYLDKGVDTSLQDTEIAIVSEYLPQQMDETALRALLTKLSADAPEGKSARGFYMKELNGSHKGQFDPKIANQIVAEMVG